VDAMRNYEEMVCGVLRILERQQRQAQSDLRTLLTLKNDAIEDPLKFIHDISSVVRTPLPPLSLSLPVSPLI